MSRRPTHLLSMVGRPFFANNPCASRASVASLSLAIYRPPALSRDVEFIGSIRKEEWWR